MKTKQLLIAAVLGLGALTMNAAIAHGEMKPRHGGIVQTAKDINFELVADADGATIYLVDHDQDMPAKGIAGKLTVLNGEQKTVVDLKATEGNKLRATGVKIAKGAKVVAALENIEGKSVTVRFTVK